MNKKSDKYSNDKDSDTEKSDDDYNPTHQVLFSTNVHRRSDRLNTISSNKGNSVKTKPNNGNAEISKAGPSRAVNEGHGVKNAANSYNNINESDAENLSTENGFSPYMCTCCSAGPSHSSCFIDDSNESNAESITNTNDKQRNKSDKQLLGSFFISSDEESNQTSWLQRKRKTYQKNFKHKLINFISSDKSGVSSSEESSLSDTGYCYKPKAIPVHRRHTSSEDNFSSSDELDPNEDFDSNNPKHVRKHIRQLVKDGYERIKNEMGKTTYHSIIPEKRDNNFTPFSPEETPAALNLEDDDKLDSEGRIKINLDDGCDFQRFVTLVLPYLPSDDDDDDISNTPGFKKWSAELDEKYAKIERKKLETKKKREKSNSDFNKSHSKRKKSRVTDISVNPVQSKKMEDQQGQKVTNGRLGSHKPANIFIEKQKNEVSKDEQLSSSVQSISTTQQKKNMHFKQAKQINNSVQSTCKNKLVLAKRSYKSIPDKKSQQKSLRDSSSIHEMKRLCSKKSLRSNSKSTNQLRSSTNQKRISVHKQLSTVSEFISSSTEQQKVVNIKQPKKIKKSIQNLEHACKRKSDVTRNKPFKNSKTTTTPSTTEKRRSVRMRQKEPINKSVPASELTCNMKHVLDKRHYKPIPVIKSQNKALRSNLKSLKHSRLSIKNKKYISAKKQLSTDEKFLSTAAQKKKSLNLRQPKKN